MLAALRSRNGEMKLGSASIPIPKAKQVQIKVMAAAINPVDYKLPHWIAGKYVGIDVAGIVTATGSDSMWSVGDEVFGFAAEGSLKEFAVADDHKLARKAASLDWLQAAALPIAYATSYQALKTHGHLQPGQSLLILGASGGCGSAGLLLAAAMKASPIVAVCSAANREMCLQLGATKVVDYTDAAAYESFKASDKFDLVYDCASGSGNKESYQDDARICFLKPGGKIIAINGGAWQWLRMCTKLQSNDYQLIVTKQSGVDLTSMLDLLLSCSSDFKPTIDSTHLLTDEGILKGFERLKSRRARGKIVYSIGSASTSDESPTVDATEQQEKSDPNPSSEEMIHHL